MGMSRPARVTLVLTLSVLALGIAAAAVIAGLIESGRSGTPVSAGLPPVQAPTVQSSLSVIRPTATPEPARTPPPSMMQVTPEAPPPAAEVPEIIETLQAPAPPTQPPVAQPPALTRPAVTKPATVCPSGAVVSGLTDVAVQNVREWIIGHIMDVVGHGSIHNGTSAAVDISLYLPYIQGLDAAGRLTWNSFTGDFDYTPPPGTPRPGTLSIPPGHTAVYTFTAKDITSEKMRETVAWYSDPEYPVGRYSDFRLVVDCPKITVTAHPHGPSLLNTYRAP